MTQEERDKQKNDIALFRYGLIVPIINGTYEEKSKEEYYRKLASKTYILNGAEVKFTSSTFKIWYLRYKKWIYVKF